MINADYGEPTTPPYTFSAGTTDEELAKICQCCVPIENDGRLEMNETFTVFLETSADRIGLNKNYTGTVHIIDTNDGIYCSLYITVNPFMQGSVESIFTYSVGPTPVHSSWLPHRAYMRQVYTDSVHVL